MAASEAREKEKVEVKEEGAGNEEEENKNSDIYNAEAGSYFNQKCLIGFQSNNGDPTLDGI